MDTIQIRNLDLNPDFYGNNSEVRKVLDTYYPDFDINMTSSENVNFIQTSLRVSIKLSNIRVSGRSIVPDKVSINGIEIEGYEFEEVIEQTKQYDIEVSFNGKTTIKTRTFLIVRAAYIVFSNITETFPTLSGTKIDLIADGVKRVSVTNDAQRYMWIAIPRNNVKLLSVLPIGLVEDLGVSKVGNDGVYDYWKSLDKLNKGEWEFLLKVEAHTNMGYDTLTTSPEDTDDLSSTLVLKTSDRLILKCLA